MLKKEKKKLLMIGLKRNEIHRGNSGTGGSTSTVAFIVSDSFINIAGTILIVDVKFDIITESLIKRLIIK